MVQPRHHYNLNLLIRWTQMLAAPAQAWSVFQQIFAEHWEAFQHAHPRYQTPYWPKPNTETTSRKLPATRYRAMSCGGVICSGIANL